MTRCGAGGKKRELRNIVRSSRFFLQPCCRSGWSRPTSGAQCSSGDCLLLCSGRPFAPSPRPRQSSGACLLLRYRPARSFPAPFPGRGALFPAGTPSRPFRYRPARFFSAPFHGAGRSLPGRYSFEALSLSAGPVLLRTFSRGGVLPSRPALLRGPFAIGRPGSSPLLFTGRGASSPACLCPFGTSAATARRRTP